MIEQADLMWQRLSNHPDNAEHIEAIYSSRFSLVAARERGLDEWHAKVLVKCDPLRSRGKWSAGYVASARRSEGLRGEYEARRSAAAMLSELLREKPESIEEQEALRIATRVIHGEYGGYDAVELANQVMLRTDLLCADGPLVLLIAEVLRRLHPDADDRKVANDALDIVEAIRESSKP